MLPEDAGLEGRRRHSAYARRQITHPPVALQLKVGRLPDFRHRVPGLGRAGKPRRPERVAKGAAMQSDQIVLQCVYAARGVPCPGQKIFEPPNLLRFHPGVLQHSPVFGLARLRDCDQRGISRRRRDEGRKRKIGRERVPVQ